VTTERVELRVPRADLIRWKTTAGAEGLSLSKWIRSVCDASAVDQQTLDVARKMIADRRKRGVHE
jgi:predicted DNA binding CopG/RHH family protein